jgi:hypothetical protein
MITDDAAADADADADADCKSTNSSSDEPEKPLHGPSKQDSPGKLSSSAFGTRNITNADIKFPAKINREADTRYTRRIVLLQPDMTLKDQ